MVDGNGRSFSKTPGYPGWGRVYRPTASACAGPLPVHAVAAKGVYGPGPGHNFAAMRHSPRDEVFVSGAERNALPIDNQCVASLHHDHVFVEFVRVGRGGSGLAARPKCHLAPAGAVEHVALDSRRRLIGL